MLQSASGRGRGDNGRIESLFSLKAKLTRGVVFPTVALRAKLRQSIRYYTTRVGCIPRLATGARLPSRCSSKKSRRPRKWCKIAGALLIRLRLLRKLLFGSPGAQLGIRLLPSRHFS